MTGAEASMSWPEGVFMVVLSDMEMGIVLRLFICKYIAFVARSSVMGKNNLRFCGAIFGINYKKWYIYTIKLNLQTEFACKLSFLIIFIYICTVIYCL